MEYACAAWHFNLNNYQRHKIELAQKRALRIIFPNLHYNEALDAAKCESLDDRRQLLCNTIFKKMSNQGSKLN